MFTNRFFCMFMVAALLLTACAPPVPATPNATSAPVATAAQDKPITLQLAVSDAQQNPSGPYALEFIQQVKTLSNGDITIEPVWEAGDTTEAGFEIGVIQLVKKGDMELGLAASRAFDNENINSFQALQAPFLITDDNLAKAAATSDVGTRMLEDLTSAGLIGLTLWPEDLRHPFSLIPGKPLLSPEDFAGLSIRTTPSVESNQLMEALGGKPIYAENNYQGAESGLRQGYSLTGTPIATANVTFFAKYQVLFGNAAAFEKLTDQQRAILQDAAAATQKKAIAEHPGEADAGTAWCTDGGTIVLASDEQVAAFEAAARPVFDKIEQDSLNKELITAIRELKAKTDPAPGAQACQPNIAQSNTAPAVENQVWSQGLPPNGVWQVELTADDFIRMGNLQSTAKDNAGVYIWTFQDGKAKIEIHGPGITASCEAVATVVEDFVHLQYVGSPDCDGSAYDEVQWRLDADGLHFHYVDSNDMPAVLKAEYESKPWQKVEEWSQGLLPSGVWQAEIKPEDILAVGGVMQSAADNNAGVHTFTFHDGKFTWHLERDNPGDCEGTYALVGDVNRLTMTGDCAPEIDDVQWRLDDQGLHLHLVNIKNAPFAEIKANLEAKPYQKIAD